MKNEVAMKPFPENLFNDLRYPMPEKLAEDFTGTFMYVLYLIAPPRDVKAFILRYHNGKSFDEIAEVLGISRQRVHAVMQEVLGRFTTEHAEMMAKGMKQYMEDLLEARAEQVAAAASTLECAALRAEAYAAGFHDAKSRTADEPRREIKSTGVVLEDLGLSTRTYNAFRKNDLRTLDDILNIGDDIMSCRSFGINAFRELMSVLRAMNITPKNYYPLTIQKYGEKI